MEAKTGCGLHEIYIFFAAERIVDVFQGEISQETFRRFAGYLSILFSKFAFLILLIQFSDFFPEKRDRIFNTLILKFMDITDRLVRAVGPRFAFWIIIALVNLQIDTFFVLGFL